MKISSKTLYTLILDYGNPHIDFNFIILCCFIFFPNECPGVDWAFLLGFFAFLGDKFMESTPLFYGAYNGTFIFIYDNITFDFPLAYFLVILAIFFISLAWLVITSRKSIKGYILNKIEIEDGDWTIFPIVFGGWDHKIRWEYIIALSLLNNAPNYQVGCFIQKRNKKGKTAI